MARLFFPILLVGSAIALFVLYTNPTYQEAQELQKQSSSFNDALNKAQELRAQRDKLLSKRNTFSSENVQKLSRALPDNVDNIRLIIDINNVAARHGLTLRNVALGTVSTSATARSELAVGASGSAVGSVNVGFGLSANYDSFLSFLADLEHSLRIIDVEEISFAPGENGLYSFSLSIRTYWLQ